MCTKVCLMPQENGRKGPDQCRDHVGLRAGLHPSSTTVKNKVSTAYCKRRQEPARGLGTEQLRAVSWSASGRRGALMTRGLPYAAAPRCDAPSVQIGATLGRMGQRATPTPISRGEERTGGGSKSPVRVRAGEVGIAKSGSGWPGWRAGPIEETERRSSAATKLAGSANKPIAARRANCLRRTRRDLAPRRTHARFV
jgi:hypothetical protein